MDVRTFLKEHTLIFDGAMGSYLMTKYHRPADGCETTNLEAPEPRSRRCIRPIWLPAAMPLKPTPLGRIG